MRLHPDDPPAYLPVSQLQPGARKFLQLRAVSQVGLSLVTLTHVMSDSDSDEEYEELS